MNQVPTEEWEKKYNNLNGVLIGMGIKDIDMLRNIKQVYDTVHQVLTRTKMDNVEELERAYNYLTQAETMAVGDVFDNPSDCQRILKDARKTIKRLRQAESTLTEQATRLDDLLAKASEDVRKKAAELRNNEVNNRIILDRIEETLNCTIGKPATFTENGMTSIAEVITKSKLLLDGKYDGSLCTKL